MKNINFSQLEVSRYYLMALSPTSSGGFRIKKLDGKCFEKKIGIDSAINKLKDQYEKTNCEIKNNIVLPIYCLDNPSPIINSSSSFLVHGIPDNISKQISALQLKNPIDLRTKITSSAGHIGSSIIDITPERILIIGNTDEISDYLKLLGERFQFSSKSSKIISNQITKFLSVYPKQKLGSSMLIGGFGAIFSFVVAFLFTKMFTGEFACFEYVFSSVISMLVIIFFLVEEAFENRIIAFTYSWALKPRYFAWIIFLSFILLAPLGAFLSIPTKAVLYLMWASAIIINILCLLSYLGQFFREEGLSKKITIISRITTSVAIGLLFILKNNFY